MQARLKVVQDNANLKQVKLLPITVIGRAADCQLKIASTQVSRKHCRITVTDKEVLVEDLNSANGTYVNQEKIPAGEPVSVLPGTTLHIGPAAFVVDYTPPLTLETMPTTVIKSSELPFLKAAATPIPAAKPQAAVPPEAVPQNSTPSDVGSDVLAGDLPAVALPAAQTPFADATAGEESEIISGPVTFPSDAETVYAKLPGEETVSMTVSAPVVATPESTPPKFDFAVSPQVVAEASRPAPVAAPIVASAAPVAKAVTAPAQVVAKAVPAAPDPIPQAVPSAPAAGGFDFLGSAPAGESSPSSFDEFNFTATPAATPVASPPVTSDKAAAPKKSLFGLFGKKPADAAGPTAANPPVAPPPPPAPPAPPAAELFSFFSESAPQPAEAVAAPTPAPAASKPAAPAQPDDPFAFLR